MLCVLALPVLAAPQWLRSFWSEGIPTVPWSDRPETGSESHLGRTSEKVVASGRDVYPSMLPPDPFAPAIMDELQRLAVHNASEAEWPRINRSSPGLMRLFAALQQSGQLRGLPQWFQDRVALALKDQPKSFSKTNNSPKPEALLQLAQRGPPYLDWRDVPFPSTTDIIFEWNGFSPQGCRSGCKSGRSSLDFDEGESQLQNMVAKMSDAKADANSAKAGIQSLKRDITAVQPDIMDHQVDVDRLLIDDDEEADGVAAVYEALMAEWEQGSVEASLDPITAEGKLVSLIPTLENGIERDYFMSELVKLVEANRAMIVSNLTSTEDGSYNGRLNAMFDEFDLGMGEEVQKLDGLVGTIENELETTASELSSKVQSLSRNTARSVANEIETAIQSTRSIGGELDKAKTSFLRNAAKLAEFIHETKATAFTSIEDYTDDLTTANNRWKTMSEKATQKQFKKLTKNIAHSIKAFGKVAKAVKYRHRRELQLASKGIKRQLDKAVKYIRRKSKVMRKEIQNFDTGTKRLEKHVQRQSKYFTDTIRRANETIDAAAGKIKTWMEQLDDQKSAAEMGINDQLRGLYRTSKQASVSIINDANKQISRVERSMDKSIKMAKKRFLRKMESEETAIYAIWDRIQAENSPLIAAAKKLESAEKGVADHRNMAEMVIDNKIRAVDLAGKKAVKSSDNHVKKAIDEVAKYMQGFKGSVEDDRPDFFKKLTDLRSRVATKSISMLKAFSEWIVGQTSGMQGTLEGLDEAWKTSNTGFAEKRLNSELHGTDSQVKVLHKRYHELEKMWMDGSKEFHQDISAAITDAMQVATSMSAESNEHLFDMLHDAKEEALSVLHDRRKYGDAAAHALDDFAESKEKEWATRSGEQAKVIQAISSDMKNLDRSVADFIEKASDKGNALREEVERLQGHADALKIESERAAKTFTSNSQKALTSFIDGLLNTVEEKHVQMQSEASAKWTRLTATLPKQVKDLKSRLASVVSSQEQRVSDVTREAKKLNNFADFLKGGGKNNAYQFLKGVDAITNAAVDLLGTVKDGSAADVVKAQMEQMKHLMDVSISQISEKSRTKMEDLMAIVNNKIAAIMANGELTEDERKAALAAIQTELRIKAAQILSKDSKMAPMVQQYMSDVRYAQELEEREVSDETDIAKAFGEERVEAAQQTAEAAKQERKYALEVTQRALREQDRDAEDAENYIATLNAEDTGDAKLIQEATDALQTHVGGDLNAAHSMVVAAAAQAKKHTEFASSILDRENALMKDTKTFAGSEADILQRGIKGEELKEATGLLRQKDVREDFVQELSLILENVGNVSTSMLEKRISRVDQMKKEIDFSFQALKELGHETFGEEVLKALAFGKMVLVNMINMKLQMYDAMKMRGEMAESGDLTEQEFAALRQDLLQQAVEREAKSTQLEAAFRKKLEAMGALGKVSAEHLSAFLHQLSFQLATGEREGFEDILGQMKNQFGFSIQAGDSLHATLGDAMTPLLRKENAAKDYLLGVNHKLHNVLKRFDVSRGRILKELSKEGQLSTLTTEELAERTRQIKALVAQLSDWHEPAHGFPSFLEATNQRKSLLARVKSLSKRLAGDAKRRAAAVEEQQVLARQIQGNLRATEK